MLRLPNRQKQRYQEQKTIRKNRKNNPKEIGTLHVHFLPLKWTASPRVQEVLSKCNDHTNVKRASLRHINDPAVKFYNLIAGKHIFYLPEYKSVTNRQD